MCGSYKSTSIFIFCHYFPIFWASISLLTLTSRFYCYGGGLQVLFQFYHWNYRLLTTCLDFYVCSDDLNSNLYSLQQAFWHSKPFLHLYRLHLDYINDSICWITKTHPSVYSWFQTKKKISLRVEIDTIWRFISRNIFI